MMEDKPRVFSIVDMEGNCEDIRKKVYGFLEISLEDYEYITLKQIASLLKEHSVGLDDNDRVLITQESLDDVVYLVEQWVLGFMLARDAANCDMKCYWDDETNEIMIMGD